MERRKKEINRIYNFSGDMNTKSSSSDKRIKSTVAEFKEFERRFKFMPRLKYGWLHLKLYQMFQDLSRRLI